MPHETRTVGQLARRCGLPISTLRYYEREGLLVAPARSEGGYRLYDETSVERLHFIQTAQSVGFALTDIKCLLNYREGNLAPCGEVQSLIQERMSAIADRVRHLKKFQKELQGALTECREKQAAGRCAVIDQLSTRSEAEVLR